MTFILAVDDDRALLRTLTINLRARDYDVETARDGRTALHIVRERLPDLVLLDLGLPDLDGVAVLKQLRSFTQTPVVVLSGRHESDDKVEALDLGANDYVTKPFGMEELLARVRSQLRAGAVSPDSTRPALQTATLRLDFVDHTAYKNGEPVHLTPTEWRLLEVLTHKPGRLVRHAELLREVWGPTHHNETNYLRVYLAQLRRKLETEPSRPRHLMTEPGIGYRFNP